MNSLLSPVRANSIKTPVRAKRIHTPVQAKRIHTPVQAKRTRTSTQQAKHIQSPFWAAIPLMLAVTGCGSNPMIRSVNFQNEEIGGKVHLNVDATLGVNLPELFPIVLPIAQVGSLTVKGRHVILEINATDALRLHSCDGSRLPNGAAIPVTPPAKLEIACIPINGSDSRIYLGFTGRQWLAGFALALKMKSPVRLPINVMLPIALKDPNIQAVGGTYFGDVSGLGIFAVKTDPEGSPTIGRNALFAAGDAGSLRTEVLGEFQLKSDALSGSRKKALEKAYYENDRVRVD